MRTRFIQGALSRHYTGKISAFPAKFYNNISYVSKYKKPHINYQRCTNKYSKVVHSPVLAALYWQGMDI
jgi:hypothetical protein